MWARCSRPTPHAAPVPETPGAADPTQMLPGAGPLVGAYDPNGMTSVLPPVGAADATSVLPSTGAPGADPTSVMPPVQRPDQPHPWQSQMQAARDRNEQTQIQYLDPNEDPLRRRPQRQAPPPPQHRPQQQQPYRQGPPPQQQQYQQPQQPQYRQPQQPPQQQYAPQPPPQHYQPQQHQPQPYQQQPQQQPQYRQPQQQPPQAPPQQRPAPREPREPRRRSANPVRIPGLGCLKGCLVLILVFFVAGWLVWELTPLQGWIGTGRGWWDQVWTWGSDAVDWVSTIGDSWLLGLLRALRRARVAPTSWICRLLGRDFTRRSEGRCESGPLLASKAHPAA